MQSMPASFMRSMQLCTQSALKIHGMHAIAMICTGSVSRKEMPIDASQSISSASDSCERKTHRC